MQRANIFKSQGVYIWFRDGMPIYVGEALGRNCLDGRLGAHLTTNNDLSPGEAHELEVALRNEWPPPLNIRYLTY